jgi:hypothetical protein
LEASLSKKLWKTSLKNNKEKTSGGLAQVLKHLPSKYKAKSSNPNAARKNIFVSYEYS